MRWSFAYSGAPGHVQEEAVEVAACESGLDPKAVNGRHLGLFQLRWDYHGHRLPGSDPLDPVANSLVAASLWADQGWDPWDPRCRP